VVYTTFHHPMTQANVITTTIRTGQPISRIQGDGGAGVDLQRPSKWQEKYRELSEQSRRITKPSMRGMSA